MSGPGPKTCAHCHGDLTGASTYTIQGIDVCADIRRCLAQQAGREQQPAEATDGEQMQDGTAGRVPGLLCRTTGMHDGVRHYCTLNTAPHKVHQDGTSGHVWTDSGEEFQAVLTERAALAARVAELEGEREADTRAVARCQQAKAGPDAVPAMLALDARFADRIAALKSGETVCGFPACVHPDHVRAGCPDGGAQ
jgi:hypothetical protein